MVWMDGRMDGWIVRIERQTIGVQERVIATSTDLKPINASGVTCRLRKHISII